MGTVVRGTDVICMGVEEEVEVVVLETVKDEDPVERFDFEEEVDAADFG